ncbi:MAG: hypothetical protein LBQ48_01060, partial [Oscillospiraceae bacterium]|nr:hypothetical protein [Oscillospiraceae bacterium]
MTELPEEWFVCLSLWNISAAEVFFCALCDISPEGEYRDRIFALTKNGLYSASRAAGDVRTFPGYRTNKAKKQNNSQFTVHSSQNPWTVAQNPPNESNHSQRSTETSFYPITALSKAEIFSRPGGGEFSVYIDGNPVRLAMLSGHLVRDARKLCETLNRLAEGKELKPDEFSPGERDRICPRCHTPYPEKERRVCPVCMDRRAVFLRTLSFFKPHRARIVMMIAVITLGGLLSAVAPYLGGRVLYDEILGKNAAKSALSGLGLSLLTVILLQAAIKLLSQILGVIQGRIVARIVPNVVAQVRSAVFGSLSRLSLRFFLSRQTGTLMTRVISDANEITQFYIDGLPYILVNGLTVVTSIAMMFTMDWRLAAAAAVMIPVLLAILLVWSPAWWRAFTRRHKSTARLNSQINDSLSGARVVKAFGREQGEIERFSRTNNQMRESELGLLKLDTRMGAIFSAAENLLILLIWVFGSWFVMRGMGLSLGTIISFQSYAAALGGPLDFFSYVFRWGANCQNSAQRIFEIIDSPPDVAEAPSPLSPARFNGEVELKNVTFRYTPNADILKKVSLKAEAGKML